MINPLLGIESLFIMRELLSGPELAHVVKQPFGVTEGLVVIEVVVGHVGILATVVVAFLFETFGIVGTTPVGFEHVDGW
jgi:hypothetical protein